MQRTFIASALAVAIASPAVGAETDLAPIRDQIEQLKAQYEARLKALETAEAAGRAALVGPGSASESAFNPAVSLILQGAYGNFSRDPETFRLGGFIPGGGEGLGPRGFSLGESELSIAANIDPNFRGNLTASITPEDTIEVEEAFVHTLGLSNGFTIKAGRFFSSIGYLNDQHQHAWDFVDAPLANQAFLGAGARGNFGDEGVQVKWLAPTELFVEFGAEAGRGLSFPGSNRNKNGTGLGTAFVHLGDDVGTSHAWRAGVSYLKTRAQDRQFDDSDAGVTNSFSGNSQLWIADFIWKWAPEGNAKTTNFKFQGEYFRRKEDGTLTYDVDAAATGPLSDTYASRQSGWYLQAAYQFAPYWRVGVRHDQLDPGSTDIGLVNHGTLSAADFPLLASFKPKRSTVMADYSPSEFSRIRVQYARDESRPDGVKDNQVFVQYLYSLGAHGAHKF
jgi:hypothetical protein